MHGRNSRNKPSYIWSQHSPCCVGTFFIAWLIWSWDWCTATVVWIIVAVTVVAFLYLIKVHGRLFAKKAYLEAVLDICRKEVRLSRHDFTGCDTGEDFSMRHMIIPPTSIFSEINLFFLTSTVHRQQWEGNG